MIQEFINRVASKINPQPTFEDKLKAQTVISSKMLNAIKLWTEMYTDMPPWKGEKGLETKTQNIPAAIAREFARLITQESEISVGGDERGAYINEQLQRFLRYFPQKVEMYCAKGGIFIKPYMLCFTGINVRDLQTFRHRNSHFHASSSMKTVEQGKYSAVIPNPYNSLPALRMSIAFDICSIPFRKSSFNNSSYFMVKDNPSVNNDQRTDQSGHFSAIFLSASCASMFLCYR